MVDVRALWWMMNGQTSAALWTVPFDIKQHPLGFLHTRPNRVWLLDYPLNYQEWQCLVRRPSALRYAMAGELIHGGSGSNEILAPLQSPDRNCIYAQGRQGTNEENTHVENVVTRAAWIRLWVLVKPWMWLRTYRGNCYCDNVRNGRHYATVSARPAAPHQLKATYWKLGCNIGNLTQSLCELISLTIYLILPSFRRPVISGVGILSWTAREWTICQCRSQGVLTDWCNFGKSEEHNSWSSGQSNPSTVTK